MMILKKLWTQIKVSKTIYIYVYIYIKIACVCIYFLGTRKASYKTIVCKAKS